MDKCVEYVVAEREGQTLSVHGGDLFNIPLSPLATIPSLQYPAKGRKEQKRKEKQEGSSPSFPILATYCFYIPFFCSHSFDNEMNKGM